MCVSQTRKKTRSNITADLHVGTVHINSHSLASAGQQANEFNICIH